jgi:hypothetical protein
MAADVTKIADINVTGSSTDTITFSSIPQTYKTLMLMSSFQSNRAGGSNDGFRINGLSTSIYTTLYAAMDSKQSGGGRSIGTISSSYGYHLFSNTNAQAADTLSFGNITYYFPDYTNTSRNKLALSMGGYANFETAVTLYNPVSTGVNAYKIATNDAITQIQFGLYESPYIFKAGSIFTLYGIS